MWDFNESASLKYKIGHGIACSSRNNIKDVLLSHTLMSGCFRVNTSVLSLPWKTLVEEAVLQRVPRRTAVFQRLKKRGHMWLCALSDPISILRVGRAFTCTQPTCHRITQDRKQGLFGASWKEMLLGRNP